MCLRYRTTLRFDIFRSWSIGTALIFDTQNPGILGILTAHAHKYETKRKAKMKKMTFLLASHQSTFDPEKHDSADRQ